MLQVVVSHVPSSGYSIRMNVYTVLFIRPWSILGIQMKLKVLFLQNYHRLYKTQWTAIEPFWSSWKESGHQLTAV